MVILNIFQGSLENEEEINCDGKVKLLSKPLNQGTDISWECVLAYPAYNVKCKSILMLYE